jgi:hypothetical protein
MCMSSSGTRLTSTGLTKAFSASVISDFYPTSTPQIAPAASTSLASALNAVQTSWVSSPAESSVDAAILSAAPPAAQTSFSKGELGYKEVTAQPWYTKVPAAQQTALAKYDSAIDSAAAKVVGTPSTSKNAGPKQTAMAMAGVVGMVVVAAL